MRPWSHGMRFHDAARAQRRGVGASVFVYCVST